MSAATLVHSQNTIHTAGSRTLSAQLNSSPVLLFDAPMCASADGASFAISYKSQKELSPEKGFAPQRKKENIYMCQDTKAWNSSHHQWEYSGLIRGGNHSLSICIFVQIQIAAQLYLSYPLHNPLEKLAAFLPLTAFHFVLYYFILFNTAVMANHDLEFSFFYLVPSQSHWGELKMSN